jgi:benzylsuccinate CoA-transferase BbsF subunit
MAFNSVNMNKKSLTLDLSKPEGVALARRLAAQSDVVVDNMRPGALEKLGLGYEALRSLRADIIGASSSGRGNVGEEREFLGYAMVHQAIGGGAYITGYPEDHPSHSGGDVDLMNAMALDVAILAALHHRRNTGEGQFIDYSQCEGVTSLLGEVLLGYQMTGVIPERDGNRDPELAPHAVYRAWGADRWLAIEVRDDAQFKQLAQCMGQEQLAADPRFATARARKANEGELDQIVEAWTRERDRDWLVGLLDRAGVAAAPSRDANDLYADPHLAARGAFVQVDHPELGELKLVAPPWQIADQPRQGRCAPCLGQDNVEVLRDLLGLDPSEIESLARKDVIFESN